MNKTHVRAETYTDTLWPVAIVRCSVGRPNAPHRTQQFMARLVHTFYQGCTDIFQ